MVVKIEDIEIRGYEVKLSKKNNKEYMLVRFEDSTGKSYEIVDRDMENKAYYKRGIVGDIYANLEINRTFTRFDVSRFVINND